MQMQTSAFCVESQKPLTAMYDIFGGGTYIFTKHLLLIFTIEANELEWYYWMHVNVREQHTFDGRILQDCKHFSGYWMSMGSNSWLKNALTYVFLLLRHTYASNNRELTHLWTKLLAFTLKLKKKKSDFRAFGKEIF